MLIELVYENNSDGVCLHCTNPICRRRYSVRRRSFFQHGKLTMRKMMKMIICFVSSVTVSATSNLLNIRRQTVTDFFDNYRSEYVQILQSDLIIFEDNGIYEVDELYLRHVRDGRARVYSNIWIGSIVERNTGISLVYPLADR